MMKKLRTVFCWLAMTLVCAIVLTGARADEWNKKTIVTFSQSVEVPGKILPAGTYTFKLLDSPSDRHIVQIFNADGSELITTILAINDYRLQPTGDTIIKFTERSGDSPDALRAWFYPGDNFGQEFVYPKDRAMQLAQVNHYAVPSAAATIDDSSMKTTPIRAATADEKDVEVETAVQTTPSVAITATPAPVTATTPMPVATQAPVAVVHETEELPKTASSMPLIALLGGLSISLALGAKLLLKLAS
ncbi:MAG: hypothetical protein PVS2B2_00290 [Candidatus Acidiferrum sp.]